jgi:hypothetical protein
LRFSRRLWILLARRQIAFVKFIGAHAWRELIGVRSSSGKF